jgi:diguanylate cyclase (GGDEF)-like protein
MIVVALFLGWASFAAKADTGSITTLAAIHTLTNDQASQHQPVKFEATLTYHRGYERTLFVQDGDSAIYVQIPKNIKLALGDRILVQGTMHESFRPFVMASDIKVVGHGELPKVIPAAFDDLIHARYDCRLVTVRAMVRSADVLNHLSRNSTMQMLADGGNIDATVDTDQEDALKALLDAEVEVTGVASGKFDGKMQQTGVLLHITSMDYVKLIKRAETSPWSLPVTPMDEILTGYHVNNLTRRVRVIGTITYYQPGSAVVLQMGSKSLWIMTQSRNDLKIGDIANATGIPDVHDGFLTLTRGEIKDSGVSAPVYPHPSTWSDLTQSRHIFDLVSIEGKVMMEVREAAQDEYVLLADGHLFSAIVRHPVATYGSLAPPAIPPMRQIPLGTTIQVAGICILEDSNPFDAQVPFNIMMRSYEDMTVVEKPSWLTVGNLMRLVSALLVIVLAVGSWGWTLRRKVKLQTANLAARAASEAALERKHAQLQHRRSKILEDINGSRPLVDVLGDITELVSLFLNGAPCWCEIADGARLGRYTEGTSGLRIAREEIVARSGLSLGVLFAAVDSKAPSNTNEKEAFFMGSRLASVAIETRRLYTDLVHRSEFDLLTDIHNRFSLDKELETLIALAKEKAGVFGLIYVDLDEFKQVNDLYGHHVGDLYLQEVSLRMKRQLRAGDLLARLGGDEFAALVPAAHHRAGVEEIALRLEQCFKEPFTVEGYVLNGSASVGIALYPEDGTTKDSLLSAADAAMYVAKHTKQQEAVAAALSGGSRYVFRKR